MLKVRSEILFSSFGGEYCIFNTLLNLFLFITYKKNIATLEIYIKSNRKQLNRTGEKIRSATSNSNVLML